ncbi:MAG: MFS transporter [Ignavibacteria bacterium]|nr:MFS transporter [Ignavibacteria bacterium]
MSFTNYLKSAKTGEIQGKNLVNHLLDGVFYNFSMSITPLLTVIPAFIHQMGGSETVVGLVPVLWGIGCNLPQLFFQPGSHLRNIKHTLIRLALITRLFFLGLGVAAIAFLPYTSPAVSAGVVLFLLAGAAISGSFAIPAWYHFFSKTVPVRFRGRLIALRQFTGSLLGISAGFIIAYCLAVFIFPVNYGILFLLTFFIMMISLFFLNRVIEPDSAHIEATVHDGMRRALGGLLRDKIFVRYLAADFIGQWLSTILSFFAIYGLQKFALAEYHLGSFTSVYMAGMMLANFILGYLGDKYGHKVNIVIFFISVAISCSIAIFARNVLYFNLVFIFMGFSQTVLGMSRIAILLEMVPENKQRLYVSALGTLSSPFLLSGVLQGYLLTKIGFIPVLWTNIIVAFLGAAFTYLYVAEPRRKTLQ